MFLWLLGLFFNTQGLPIFALVSLLASILLVVFATGFGIREDFKSFSTPIANYVGYLKRFNKYQAGVVLKLLEYEQSALESGQKLLEARKAMMSRKLDWVFGSAQKAGFLPILGAVVLAVYEFYNSSGSLSISLVVSAFVVGLMIGYAHIGKIVHWLNWSIETLSTAIENQCDKSKLKANARKK